MKKFFSDITEIEDVSDLTSITLDDLKYVKELRRGGSIQYQRHCSPDHAVQC